jgi:hypothetical protein
MVPRRTGVLILAGAFVACQKTFPAAPSELSRGVVIYEHANYLGQTALLEQSAPNLNDYKGPCEQAAAPSAGPLQNQPTFTWKNCVSSIRVAPGWKATIYTDTDFGGKSLEVSADVANLQLVSGACDHGGLNDCIESVRVGPN